MTSDRSDGQQEQSCARLRTYETTQAPWLHGSRLPSRGSGNAGSLGRRTNGSLGLQTGDSPERRRQRVFEHLYKEGSTRISGSAKRVFRSRALHSTMLGPCCPEKQFPGLPPSTEALRHQAHRPRLERGDAPARGTRRGSTEGMAPWRHLTAGSNPAGLVTDTGGLRQCTRQAELARGGNTPGG